MTPWCNKDSAFRDDPARQTSKCIIKRYRVNKYDLKPKVSDLKFSFNPIKGTYENFLSEGLAMWNGQAGVVHAFSITFGSVVQTRREARKR